MGTVELKVEVKIYRSAHGILRLKGGLEGYGSTVASRDWRKEAKSTRIYIHIYNGVISRLIRLLYTHIYSCTANNLVRPHQFLNR